MALLETLIGIIAIITLIYFYFQQSFKHWDKLNVTSVKPTFPFGSIGYKDVKKGLYAGVRKCYLELKSKKVKYGGAYLGPNPILIPMDIDLIKTILTKDFQSFASHGTEIEAVDPILAHLFNLSGQEWKDMRVKLTPTFTSGKMKMMFNTLLDCGHQLENFLDETYKQNKPFDVKEIMACFTTDIIGSCAFGVECNSFQNPDAEFRKNGRKLFTPSVITFFRRLVGQVFPTIKKTLKINTIDPSVRMFFMDAVKNLVNYREQNNVTRNDFMQILLNMKAKAQQEGSEGFTMEQLTAQSLIFFIAGFETSSTTMSFCMYELAYNQEVQDRVRAEMNEVLERHDNKISYDAIMEMKYLDQVLQETLRKYPPTPILPRTCTKDYKFEDGVEIKKGTSVFINIFSMHRDEDYFSDPEKFDPDRFSDENKDKIKPFSYIPFGEGPRICIGLRFGLMQAKVGLTLLLKNYKLHPQENIKYPMDFDPKALVLSFKGKILLKAEKV
nr:cytochrome P450 6a2-like [Onthophagus taurus]